MRNIVIEIDEDGQVHIETKGFQGPSCMKEVEAILAELRKMGIEAKTEKLTKTPEYHATITAPQKVRI